MNEGFIMEHTGQRSEKKKKLNVEGIDRTNYQHVQFLESNVSNFWINIKLLSQLREHQREICPD